MPGAGLFSAAETMVAPVLERSVSFPMIGELLRLMLSADEVIVALVSMSEKIVSFRLWDNSAFLASDRVCTEGKTMGGFSRIGRAEFDREKGGDWTSCWEDKRT